MYLYGVGRQDEISPSALPEEGFAGEDARERPRVFESINDGPQSAEQMSPVESNCRVVLGTEYSLHVIEEDACRMKMCEMVNVMLIPSKVILCSNAMP
jgi:hypothetical protein